MKCPYCKQDVAKSDTISTVDDIIASYEDTLEEYHARYLGSGYPYPAKDTQYIIIECIDAVSKLYGSPFNVPCDVREYIGSWAATKMLEVFNEWPKDKSVYKKSQDIEAKVAKAGKSKQFFQTLAMAGATCS